MQPETSLEDLRDEVFLTLGRTLVNLQRYEQMLKFAVSRLELSGNLQDAEEIARQANHRVSKMTLGTLVNELKAKGFIGTDTPDETQDNLPEGHFVFRAKLLVHTDAQDDVAKGLADLVATRNHLAHGFTETFNLKTREGCLAALGHFEQEIPKLAKHYDELLGWIKAWRAGAKALQTQSEQ